MSATIFQDIFLIFFLVFYIKQNVFIIGESGCGKSTLFRELAKQVIEQNGLRNDYELYPIITTFNHIL